MVGSCQIGLIDVELLKTFWTQFLDFDVNQASSRKERNVLFNIKGKQIILTHSILQGHFWLPNYY